MEKKVQESYQGDTILQNGLLFALKNENLKCCHLKNYLKSIQDSLAIFFFSESTSEVLRTFQQLQDNKQRSELQKMR